MDINFSFPQFVNFSFGSNLLSFQSSKLVCPSTSMDQQIAGFQIELVRESILDPKIRLSFNLFK